MSTQYPVLGSPLRTKGAVWAARLVIGCIGFYSIPTGIVSNLRYFVAR